MKILKLFSRAEWCMFAITVALLILVHTYCTGKVVAEEGFVVEAGPQTPVEVVVEDEEIVEEDSTEAEKHVVRPVEDPEDALDSFIFHTALKYDLKPELVTAIIMKESGGNPEARGDSGRSLGLMQIQPKWHQWRMDELFGPATEFDSAGVDIRWFNPYRNVEVGCHILRDLYDTGLSEEWILMAYNGGYSYAHKKVSEGIVSDYARDILSKI